MSERKFIKEEKSLPKWENHISHAVVAGNMCFVSGQLSINENGKYIEGPIKEEALRAFDNVFKVLNAAGFNKEEIVYIDIAFSNLDELEEVNKIYMEIFEEDKRPARTIYEASRLPFDGKIKIVAQAIKF